MSTLAGAIGGALRARPGHPLPSILSTRREWALAVTRGKPADDLPDLLAALYTLCGGAHRATARHAVAAARGEAFAADEHPLRVDTLREHLRRLWLDWPSTLAPGLAVDVAELAGCPLLRDARADGREWVERHVLGMTAEAWLDGWQAAPLAFVAGWAESATTQPARLLAAARITAMGLRSRPAPLHAHASAHEMERLARALRSDAGFALAPTWHGRTAETGTWTRLADPAAAAADSPYASAWLRLASRVADVAHLVARADPPWLAHGALSPAAGEGLAWCEMARGLLVHWLRLDGDDRVAECRVLAPTEWNFHPFGAVARQLAQMSPNVPAARVRVLAAAFDPCVVLDIERPDDQGGEVSHA